jgi:GntR family transcriptional regulator
MPPTALETKKRIDRRSPLPFYRQLLEIILDGAWSPGDRMPSEAQLCAAFGVSRSVVRQALNELVTEGLIYKEKGQGAFFTRRKIDSAFIQQRAGFYDEMTAKGHIVESKILRQTIESASAPIASRLQLRINEEVIRLDRMRLVDGEKFQVVRTFLPGRLCRGLEKIDMTNRSLYQVLRDEFGLVPASGDRTIEAVAMPLQDAALLGVPKGSPALKVESVTQLKTNEIFEYFIGIYRGDKAKLAIRVV